MPDHHTPSPVTGWPTPSHERLLIAALAEPVAALDAWAQWLRSHSLDEADAGATRLFPLVYDHLWRHAPDLPEGARLKGLYRHTWVKNQLQARRVSEVLGAIAEAGIPTLVVKGLALQLVVYEGSGARAMEDGDVVVPTDRARDAADVLEAHGWRPAYRPLDREMRCRASTPFEHARGGSFDLHWHVLYDDMREEADDDFWTGAVPLALLGVPTRTLQPADHVLHALAHGLAWAPVAPVRWVADVVRLVQVSGAALDWDRFWRGVERHRLAWLVSPGLAYVERLLPGLLPRATVARARALRPSLGERLDFHCRMRGRTLALGYVPRFWRHFRRALPPTRYGRGPIAFASYCADTARIERSWRTPWLLAGELTRRARVLPVDGEP